MVCFGSHAILNRDEYVKIIANDNITITTSYRVDRHGYMKSIKLSQRELETMKLNYGKNIIKYVLNKKVIKAHLYLLSTNHKLLISDVDGTLTKNDFGGFLGNVFSYNYIH